VTTTSWSVNGALATDRQRRLQAEAVRQRRISEAEHATSAAMRQVRYRDAALVVLIILFALLSFSIDQEEANMRRTRSNIVDQAHVVLVEPATNVGIPTS
jgi:hypothetical protein